MASSAQETVAAMARGEEVRLDAVSESFVSSGSGSGSGSGSDASQHHHHHHHPPQHHGHRHWGLGSGDINSAAALRAQYAVEVPRPPRRRHKKNNNDSNDAAAHQGPSSSFKSNTTAISTANAVQPASTKDTAASPTTAITAGVNNSKNDNDNHEDEDYNDDTPLIDTTAPLELHSKKTSRLQRKARKRTLKTQQQQARLTTLQSLPSELLVEILQHLAPSTLFLLQRVSRYLRAVITTHQPTLAQRVIEHRYPILSHCFPLPVPFSTLSPTHDHPFLLHPQRLDQLASHTHTYRVHIAPLDPTLVCTCVTCVFAWNNLALVLDLHHWQPHLDRREPIPVVAPGRDPEWNRALLARTGAAVRRTLAEPLAYAAVLEKHLDTIARTVLRHADWTRRHDRYHAEQQRKNGGGAAPLPPPASSPAGTAAAVTDPARHRAYRMTDAELDAGTDAFLARIGSPSYDFPYGRDVYYSLEVYVPNRKWGAQTRRWHYYDPMPAPHLRDLEWVRSWGRRAGAAEGVLNVKCPGG